MKKLFALFVLSLSVVVAGGAHAADFPTKPIRFLVPFSPGTGMDRIARLVGQQLHTRLGQAVVVENKTGASGHLGARMVATAPADGYTVLVSATNLTITSSLYPSNDFNPMKDLAPLAIAGWGNASLVVSTKLNINSLQDLIAHVKANPGKLSFATPGVGSPGHMNLEQFQAATGTRFLHVPYNGTGPALADLIGGHADVMFVATHTVMSYVKKGQVKVLGVASDKRHRAAPDVPSFVELGVNGVRTDAWYGFLLPQGVPTDVAEKLGVEIRAALNLPAIKADLENFGLEVKPSTAKEMSDVMQREYKEFAEIIQKNNIRAQ